MRTLANVVYLSALTAIYLLMSSGCDEKGREDRNQAVSLAIENSEINVSQVDSGAMRAHCSFAVLLKNESSVPIKICANEAHFSVQIQAQGADIGTYHGIERVPHDVTEDIRTLEQGGIVRVELEAGWLVVEDPICEVQVAGAYDCGIFEERFVEQHANAWNGRLITARHTLATKSRVRQQLAEKTVPIKVATGSGLATVPVVLADEFEAEDKLIRFPNGEVTAVSLSFLDSSALRLSQEHAMHLLHSQNAVKRGDPWFSPLTLGQWIGYRKLVEQKDRSVIVYTLWSGSRELRVNAIGTGSQSAFSDWVHFFVVRAAAAVPRRITGQF